MMKRPLDAMLVTALRDLDAGQPTIDDLAGGSRPALSQWLNLHERLATAPQFVPSASGSTRGRQRMLAALAAPPIHAGGLQMISSLFSMVPKAAMLVFGGLVLTGSAVGASAAVGGPNIPVAVMTAVGLHADVRADAGIGNAPDAAQTGKDHANANASLGAGNATEATASGTVIAGINHAPDAAQIGKDHANANAFLGVGNASAEGTVTVTAGVGITNALDAAATGVAHADINASLGAGNADDHPADSGIVIAPDVAATGVANASANALLGAGNTNGHRP